MEKMFWLWLLVGALMVLSAQICAGETSCFLWSSAGLVVPWGSSFDVFCTFNCTCIGNMYSGDSPTKQTHKTLNSSTIYLNVVNITTPKITYSCDCESCSHLDPCGQDISAGYPPDPPANISCTYKMLKNETGIVFCTWNKGRETHLRSSYIFQSRPASNGTERPLLCNVSIKYDEPPSASFKVSGSIEFISVWIQARNDLGITESPVHNYSLSDIVMPSRPVLSDPVCISRECTITVQEPAGIQDVQIQYKMENQEEWKTFLDSVKEKISSQAWSVTLLEPYRLYHFRARSKFSTGLWSQWSSNISSWTEEEAPSKPLEMWVTPSSDLKQMGVFWKEANRSVSRGKILEYKVKVHGPNLNLLTNVSPDVRYQAVPFCADCEVTVWACNSKGLSPPATMTTSYIKAKPLHNIQTTVYKNMITVTWRIPETAPTMYVLDWYPVDGVLDELKWLRLDGNKNSTIISDMKASECYEGALYAFYNKSSVSRSKFEQVATQESAPAVGPSFKVKVEGNTVLIEWKKLSRGQRGGCITHYTIYLQNSNKKQNKYSVKESKTFHKIKDLSSDFYTLWMTASTAKGESSAHPKNSFYIEQDSQLFLILACVVSTLILLVLMCLCHNSAIKHRLWVFFQCLMLDVVPDPANSKCAKKCMEDQDQMNPRPPTINLTLPQNEEETVLVDVEELINQDMDTSNPTVIPQPTVLTDPTLKTKPYPILTTYLKSISHDSDESSENTQISLINAVDYISSNVMENEDDEFSDEDEFTQISPSDNVFFDPLICTGKLTLEAVKIDCSEFQQSA